MNYPDVMQGRHIVVIDCRAYHDPEFGKDAHHLGWKDENLAGLVNEDHVTCAIIDMIIEGIQKATGLEIGLVLAFMCKTGIHRSVVTAKCANQVIAPRHDNVTVIHLCMKAWSTRGCTKRYGGEVGRCPQCQDNRM